MISLKFEIGPTASNNWTPEQEECIEYWALKFIRDSLENLEELITPDVMDEMEGDRVDKLFPQEIDEDREIYVDAAGDVTVLTEYFINALDEEIGKRDI